jgi:hypothetical protein
MRLFVSAEAINGINPTLPYCCLAAMVLNRETSKVGN